ncbi:Peptidoglycan/xylan/chitin deacetylase, PgdA/CDA1 family [Verrucomicrobium sp. GAS474]|uniref:polysaccharide deacetylase family protein n=1 Tax=Verrucomicrobium sp. GAS474 TaxID=1882831 RepID=UPI00087B28F9|nr:polysaccharide deacetylase family protein [Verrucomicrobium sp. GAS474]SDT93707.1 Peptidoglycan/xylan/chitin deacetylase, PgdA/CDA1 family [Verrucomicrobium sp. GAS474]
MEISRKTFLRNLGLAAGGYGLGALGMGLGRALAQSPAASSASASPASASPAAVTSEVIDGEKVMRALPLDKGAQNMGGAHWVNSGPGFGRRMALSFDDGPNNKVTQRVLAELEKRNILATFFQIGIRVEAEPGMSRAVADAGHEVANHSLTHPQCNKLSDDRLAYELSKTQELIEAATGRIPVWFRPPYGAFRHDQGVQAASRGLGVALWSVDPRDWSQPGVDKIAQTILSEARPGSVVLMHDLHSQTADALPRILDGLIERGFEFTTMTGLFGLPYGYPSGALPPNTPAAAPLPEGVPTGEPAVKVPTPAAAPVVGNPFPTAT